MEHAVVFPDCKKIPGLILLAFHLYDFSILTAKERARCMES